MDAMEPQWTHEEGLRYEVAKEVLSGEIGRRNVALRALGADNEADRVRLRDERTAIMHLKQTLDIHDDRRISAILERNLDEALIDEAPMMRAG